MLRPVPGYWARAPDGGERTFLPPCSLSDGLDRLCLRAGVAPHRPDEPGDAPGLTGAPAGGRACLGWSAATSGTRDARRKAVIYRHPYPDSAPL